MLVTIPITLTNPVPGLAYSLSPDSASCSFLVVLRFFDLGSAAWPPSSLTLSTMSLRKSNVSWLCMARFLDRHSEESFLSVPHLQMRGRQFALPTFLCLLK